MKCKQSCKCDDGKLELYMAHPFDSRSKMRVWELSMETKYDVNIINPFYDLARDDIDSIDAGERGRNEDSPVTVVQRDIAAIAKSEGMIAIIDGSNSYGTIQEMVYASMLRKPVYSMISNGQEDHFWLRYHSKFITKNLEGIEEVIQCLISNRVAKWE